MDDIGRVGYADPRTHLDRDAYSFLMGKPSLLIYIFLERNSFHEFHNHVVKPAVFPNVIHIYHIRVYQPGCRLGLGTKLAHKILVFLKFLFQDLDCHVTIEHMVFAFIDIGHPPCSNLT